MRNSLVNANDPGFAFRQSFKNKKDIPRQNSAKIKYPRRPMSSIVENPKRLQLDKN
jgi:hypothetical protein